MIRVDLQLPVDPSIKTSFAKRGAGFLQLIQDPVVIGVFLIAILTFVFALVLDRRAHIRHETLDASVRSAVRDSARFEEDLRRADQLRAKREQIAQRISSIARIDQNRFAFVYALDQISAALVSDIWLESVTTRSVDGSGTVNLTITGYAPNNEKVNLYLTQLEHSPFLADATLQGTTTRPFNGHEVVQFVIAARTEIPDPSYIMTETIRPDGSRTSDLEGPTIIVEQPQDSATATIPPAADDSAGQSSSVRPDSVAVSPDSAEMKPDSTAAADSSSTPEASRQ